MRKHRSSNFARTLLLDYFTKSRPNPTRTGPLYAMISEVADKLHISIPIDYDVGFLNEIHPLFKKNSGAVDVLFHIHEDGAKPFVIKAGPEMRIALSKPFVADLRKILESYNRKSDRKGRIHVESQTPLGFRRSFERNNGHEKSRTRRKRRRKFKIPTKPPLITDEAEIWSRTLALFNGNINPGDCDER